MTTARRLNKYSYEQYLHTLADSHIKLEYFEGEIYAMAGGTASHARLGAKVIGLLERLPAKPCNAYSSDLKVLVEHADLATFPDASVVCGPLLCALKDRNCIINPVLLVEVTSPSTETYDRGEKLRCYQQVPTLRCVLLVSHRSRRVTVVRRTTSGWEEIDFVGGETLALTEPSLNFAVNELYEGVALDP